jgi:hypothetical protein
MNKKKTLTFCFTGENTNIEDFLNINGYYEIKTPYIRKVYQYKKPTVSFKDTIKTKILFFKDGTFVKKFNDLNKNKRLDSIPNINQFFKEISENPKSEEAITFKNVYDWGIYKLEGDTIKVQYINHMGRYHVYWWAYEIWYKIIDRNNIKEIFIKPLVKSDQTKREYDLRYGKFIPTDYLPPSDCRLKNYKWFW